MPDLADPHFAQSVILLCAHSEEGAFGLKVSEALNLTIDEVCQESKIPWSGDETACALFGGPVEPNRGWMVHSSNTMYPGSQDIGHGVALSASMEALRAFGRSPDAPFLLVMGYAGWGPGQLERELSEGTWLTAPLFKGLLFDTPAEKRWSAALHSIGVNAIHLVNAPTAPN
jgi:putative transcriptional regulator